MTEQTRKKPGPKPKAALPKVSVIERRLQNPHGTPSVPITLKTEGEHVVRIVNADLRTGRLHEMTHAKGWTFVEPHEIDGTPDEYGLEVRNGRLVRGERGQEVLMKMSRSDYNLIQRAKVEDNNAKMGAAGTKKLVVKQIEQAAGDQAADTMHRKFDDMISITDERGPAGLDPADMTPPGDVA
jgi:hypothetical protein